MRRFLIVLGVVAALHLIYLTTIHGANVGTPFMSGIVANISGVSDLTTRCETDTQAWETTKQRAGFPPYTAVDAFTNPAREHVVYIGPKMCAALADGPGAPLFGPAVQTLTHEALHWKLGLDEHVVECAADRTFASVMLRYYFRQLDPSIAAAALAEPYIVGLIYSQHRPAPYAGCEG